MNSERPLANMHPPAVPESPPPVLTDDQLRRLLRACEGQDFLARRDAAVLRLLIDSGARRSELAGLQVRDVDLELNVIVVLGKGRRPRSVPFGRKAARALDRYLRVRAARPDATLPALWLGQRGGLTGSGLYQLVKTRAEQAGIGHALTHIFRHGFADAWLRAGGQEGDLMVLAGWRSRAMLSRYGASAPAGRARDWTSSRSWGPRRSRPWCPASRSTRSPCSTARPRASSRPSARRTSDPARAAAPHQPGGLGASPRAARSSSSASVSNEVW